MSTRRIPLSSNPNVANSPLRGASALALAAKQKRSHANQQREELYGQPPPLKKQLLENGTQRALRSPQKTQRSQLPQRAPPRAAIATKERERPAQPRQDDAANLDKIREWQKEYRTRFPRMVFYFESIQDDLRAKLSKQAYALGAREERFFSNNITHVVTTRSIPPAEKSGQADFHDSLHEETESDEQPQTINPSLLDRSTDVRRRLLLESASRRAQNQPQDDSVRRSNPTRNTDVLHKAREMGKKIWHLEKFRRILEYLTEPDPYAIASFGAKQGAVRNTIASNKTTEEPNLLQLLQHERLNGPSDRDPTVVSRELVHFKGPYIYVYDIDEKQKPIMVREYPKVTQKYEGEWPQFRTVTDGRCPFVEEVEVADKASRKQQAQQKERAAKAPVEARPTLQPPEMPAPKVVTGKRTLTEMQDGHNKVRTGVKPMEMFNPPKTFSSKQIDFRPQNAFTSRAGAGRLFAGEPVASGVQPSNITSAIRSQMISSTSGINGAKAGTSKEVHGLQRKVLQRSATNSQDLSSRRLTEMSLDVASSRSASLGRATNRRLDLIEEDASNEGGKHARTSSRSQSQAPPLKSKRDLKPGYCENCQDKFKDFDEHVLSRKHRRFAESEDNWAELDDLLSQLKRIPKYSDVEDEEDDHH